MVPEKLKNYMFNENDFFNEGFVPADPEKHELVKKLAAMITDDIQVHSAKDITTDMPDYWILDRLLNKEQQTGRQRGQYTDGCQGKGNSLGSFPALLKHLPIPLLSIIPMTS